MNEPVIIKLKDIINNQPGAVVSKVLLKKKAGTITLFDFDEGEGLSEHTAPFDAFVHILEGEAEIVISGKQYLLSEGEAIVMPANEPHSLKAVKDFKMILVMMKEL
jgi:quercetin dioxygenase-like cupin family protein